MSREPRWEPWRPFPDQEHQGLLTAPFGAGVYWLRDGRSGEDVYIGEGGHVAQRMTSLLPAPLGHGTRNNGELREFVARNLLNIQYRTAACPTKADAVALEARLRREHACMF